MRNFPSGKKNQAGILKETFKNWCKPNFKFRFSPNENAV